MTMTTAEFCEALAKRFADISEVLTEHISDNDELLPYVFLEDVSRYVLANGRFRQQIVKHFDESFNSKGEDVENLIAVAFVEHLENREELDKATCDVEAPKIHAEWERQQVL